jgi:hypothetical protein
MSEKLFASLEAATLAQGYITRQELINACLRKVLIDSAKNKGGRPRKIEFEDAFSERTKDSREFDEM